MSTASEKLREINNSAKQQRRALANVIRRFPDLDRFVEELEAMNTSGDIAAHWGSYWGGSFSVTIWNLKSFKEQHLVDVLLYLETHFNVEFEMTDNAAYSTKNFSARVKWTSGGGQEHTFDVEVSAKLRADAAECHRVQIDEKVEVVRTPIYKLVCDDGSLT